MPLSPDIARLRCEVIVTAMIGKANEDWWWNGQNRAFQLRTPNQQWVLDWEQVYTYLMGHASR